MSYVKTSFIALSAFALGFAASEFRHAPTADNTPPHMTRQQDKMPSTLSSREPSIPPTDNKVHIPAPTTENLSLDHVHQLIAQGRYDEAVHTLKTRLENNPRSAPDWLLLAQTYEKQQNHPLALASWFNYLDYEPDVVKREHAMNLIKAYLVGLHNQPELLKDDSQWLIAQLDQLLGLSNNDGELHVLLASLYVAQDDQYQAQYHAMMAASDPSVQARAEKILAELSGTNTPDNLTVPLTRLGNQYLVEVNIEGYPARLLLDTGASLSGVSNIYAGKYPGIVKSTKPIRLNTAAGIADSYLFTVDYLTMGQVTFNQHILTLLPMGNMTEFDGLLGVDILGRFDFVIDQDALLLRLQARNN